MPQKEFKNLKIHSFEPEYSNLNLMKENLLQNNLFQRINMYSIGISDQVGMSMLHIQDINAGSALHTENKEMISYTDEGRTVQWREGIFTLTLDQICHELQTCPNSLKIDTDGNELKILTGAEKTLKNPELRSIITEIPSEKEKELACRKILLNAGFKSVWRKEGAGNEIWARVSANTS